MNYIFCLFLFATGKKIKKLLLQRKGTARQIHGIAVPVWDLSKTCDSSVCGEMAEELYGYDLENLESGG